MESNERSSVSHFTQMNRRASEMMFLKLNWGRNGV